jgi:phenylacetate 2-hydroxylase
MTEQIRKCRTAALKALGKPMWPGYFPLIEHNAITFVKALYEKGENGRKPMEMYPWLRQV